MEPGLELGRYRRPPPGSAPADLSVHLFPVAATIHLLDRGTAGLGEAELRRATRPADQDTQRKRLLSYLLLRRLLAERSGVAESALGFGVRGGLLRLTSPGVPAPPRFSLSRSSALIAVAIADHPVGVDVEDIQSRIQAEQLLATLHPADQATLKRVPGPLRPRAVTAAWARKEAGLKVLGTGLRRDPARDPTGSRRLPLGPPGVAVAQVAVPRGRRAELAVAWPLPHR